MMVKLSIIRRKMLEKFVEESKNEAIMHYSTYPENIKKIEMFNKMPGKAGKINGNIFHR